MPTAALLLLCLSLNAALPVWGRAIVRLPPSVATRTATAVACAALTNVSECVSHNHCRVDVSGRLCVENCMSVFHRADCEFQPGCRWTGFGTCRPACIFTYGTPDTCRADLL